MATTPARQGLDQRRVRPMAGNDDARAVRTRAKLLAAFDDVVRDTDPSEISVAELTRAAGVNRTSFYAHFSSPDELAVQAISELFELLGDADRASRADGTTSAAEASRAALTTIVDWVDQRRGSYARLLGPWAPAPVHAAITDAFIRGTVPALQAMPARPPQADPVVTARFLAGGVLSVVGRWLADADRDLDPDRDPDLDGKAEGRWPKERVVEALLDCLPAWIRADAGNPQQDPEPGRAVIDTTK